MSVRYLDNRRVAKRLSWVLLLTIGVALTVSLYYVKTRAQTAKNEVRALQKSIAQEQAAVKVLEAGLAFLSGPERLGDLSKENSALEPVLPKSTKEVNEISELFPLREVDDQPEGTLP